MAWAPPETDETIAPPSPAWKPPEGDEAVTGPSKLKSLGMGAAQGATFGFADEGMGVGSSIKSIPGNTISEKLMTILSSPEARKKAVEDYRAGRDKVREITKEAKAANPKTFMAGELGGGAATTLVTGPTAGVAKLAALGALSGFGGSEADLTEGDIGGVAKDTAIGAGVGAGTGVAFNGLQKVLGAFTPEALKDTAQEHGAAALGFTKKMRGTPEARTAAQEMLDKGVITPMASPSEMASGAADVTEQAGKNIGKFLGSRHGGFDTTDAVEAMGKLRPMDSQGNVLTGGQYDKINEAIDTAIKTAKAHGDSMTFEDANKLKGFLQDNVNWNSTKSEGDVGRGIAGSMREALDTSLSKVSPGAEGQSAFEEFLANKKTFGAGMRAQDALANRMGEVGKPIGVTDAALAAGELAAGSPTGAAKAIIGKNLINRYGNQTMAVAANKGADISERLTKIVTNHPETLGRGAAVLKQAMQRGPQAVAVAHFNLMNNDEEYRKNALAAMEQTGGQ